MLIDSLTTLGLGHQREHYQVKETINVAVDWAVCRPLGQAIVHVEGSLDTHFDHSPAELLEDFRILIKALLLQVVKETIDLLLLALWVIALVKGYDGPLIEVFMDSFCSPYSLLPMILYDIAE